MKWSWKIGRVAGIDVQVHATFLILLGWMGLSYYLQRHRWEDAVSGVGFIVALFAIVVLHELGHALTAKRFGIRTRDITLLPIGGVARLERIPEEPKQELLVALAGPAVNIVLAVLLLGVLLVGAAQEAGAAQMKSALAGLPVERVMITDFRTLSPDDPLLRAVEHVLAGSQQDFPVVEGKHVAGVLTRADLLTGLAKPGQSRLVGDVMQRNVCTAEPPEMVEDVLGRLQENDCRTMPVVQDGELVGILTSENLGEYLMIQTALDKSPQEKWGGKRRAATDRKLLSA